MLRRTMLKFVAALTLATQSWPAAAQESIERLRRQSNENTVGIISGGVAGTYIRVASDLASVLDDPAKLRVLAIIGKGSLQNINDVLYLRGVDIGIVQSDVFAYVKRQSLHPGIDKRVHFITKLYNEEIHLLARSEFRSVQDLAGKKVNFDNRGSGTFLTASVVFETLGVKVEPTTFDQALALEKLKTGEIAALLYVAGKPTTLFRDLRSEDGLHLMPIPLTPTMLETYLPSQFTAEDYPRLVPTGQTIETLAVGAVMAVYNWEFGTDRYNKVVRFVDAFFSRFDDFKRPPRHAKWQEVNLTAQVPGWTRFKPAEDWLRRSAPGSDPADPELRASFDRFLSQERGGAGRSLNEQQREALFQQFLRWRSNQRQ